MLYSVRDFDFNIIKNIPTLASARKRKYYYKDVITAFDIETTNIPHTTQNIMYIWQFQIGTDYTIIGRTWGEFQQLIVNLSNVLEGNRLVTYVHNLAYEFQYLRGIYDFKPGDVFLMDSRKPLRAILANTLELRCSYIHSNMSLAEYTKKFHVKHQKLSGDEFNYNLSRYPWTEMKPREIEYCVNDVLGLVEAITAEMAHDGDNLYTIPLTSTGYVRRDTKKAMLKYGRKKLIPLMPNLYIYKMLKEAFRGGNTHANRYFAGRIIENVHSYDRSSSYPDVQCNCKFPVTEFFVDNNHTKEHLLELINVREKACIMRIGMHNVKLRDPLFPCPYLSRDKCREVNDKTARFDNGRILKADYLETTITDIDFKIIINEYESSDMIILDLAHATYGELPKEMIENIQGYYKGKTELKDVAEMDIYYMKSKNLLNAIYGMSAQDPVKETMMYINFTYKLDDSVSEETLLKEFNSHAVMPYQWGVWTTAWARYRLEEGILLAGDGFVYCDTDSVKYIGEVDWTSYNKERIADSTRTGSFAIDKNGKIHYMGVYEKEKDYRRFITMGAKKYAYTYAGESCCHVTVSGVSKRLGGIELTKKGGLKAFKEGFIFSDAGGLESIYNDQKEFEPMNIDGHKIRITSNVYLKPSTYTLGLSNDYRRLLLESRI